MKADLISRSALLKKAWDADTRCGYVQVVDIGDILAAPTVDAVEVVRCKDCKWYKEGELLAPNKFCFRLMHPTDNRHIGYNFSGDDFCSYGERKDND